MSDNTCISCGMPMRTDEEHGGGDANATHCHHCSAPDGTMKSYDDVLAGMSRFMIDSQGVDADAARKMAAGMMAKLPAWKDRG